MGKTGKKSAELVKNRLGPVNRLSGFTSLTNSMVLFRRAFLLSVCRALRWIGFDDDWAGFIWSQREHADKLNNKDAQTARTFALRGCTAHGRDDRAGKPEERVQSRGQLRGTALLTQR
jgi:hypothetical protein